MSKQGDYTSEEWTVLTSAAAFSSMLVSMVDVSGPIGLLQEATAGYKAAIAALEAPGSELVHAVAASVKSASRPDMSRLPKDREALRVALVDRCRAAVAVVTARSPGEAEDYRHWLLSIATAAAEGAKEGTFLGLGGTRVSKAEAAALRHLKSALGLEE